MDRHLGLLIAILPRVADDATLAMTLAPCLSDPTGEVRIQAAQALSQAMSPQTAKVLSEQVARSFRFFPELPYRPSPHEEIAMRNRDEGIIFVHCLKGLLKSDLPEARATGLKYLNFYRVTGKPVIASVRVSSPGDTETSEVFSGIFKMPPLPMQPDDPSGPGTP